MASTCCMRCGAQSPEGARFCTRCGTPLPGPAGTAGPPPAAPPVVMPGVPGGPWSPTMPVPTVRRRPALPLVGLLVGLAGLAVAGVFYLNHSRPPAPGLLPLSTATPVTLASPAPSGEAATAVATPLPTPNGVDPTPTADAGGSGTPHVVVLQDALTFDDQDPGTTSAAKTVTLSNEGDAAQPLGQPTIAGPNPDAFAVTGTCSNSLDIASRCDENVTFTPSATGDYSARLDFTDPQGNVLASTTLSGHGGSGTPDVSVSPSALAFGNVNIGDSSSQSVDVTNNGTAAVTISSIDISPNNSGVFSLSGDCSTTGSLAAGSLCGEQVTFTPPDDSSYSATLTFSDDQNNTLGSVDLSGAGYNPNPSSRAHVRRHIHLTVHLRLRR